MSGPAAHALPNAPDAGDWVVDGKVTAIAQGAGHIFLGGDFSYVGARSGAGAPLDATSGAPLGSWAQVAGGQIDAVAAAPDGGWYIGGDFTTVDGVARFGLARLDANGQLVQSFDPEPDQAVHAIVVSTAGLDAGTVYVGGDFRNIGGAARSYAAALDPDTGVAASWNGGPDAPVYALAETHLDLKASSTAAAASEPIVFLGGAFKVVGNGWSVNGLGAVWGYKAKAPDGTSSSGTATHWNPISTTGTVVRALALGPADTASSPGNARLPVYYGGDGSLLGGARFGINLVASGSPAAWTPDSNNAGANYPSWKPTVTCPATTAVCAVRSIVVAGSTVYVGGNFTQVGGTSGPGVAELAAITDVQGGGSPTVRSWNPGLDGAVNGIAVTDKVYLAGDFAHVATTVARNGLAAVDSGSAADDGWAPAPAGGAANAIAAQGSVVYAGGAFSMLQAVHLPGLAALLPGGSIDTAWEGDGVDGPVEALALSPDGSTLYAGGGFTHVGASNAPRGHIAAFNTSDATLRPWGVDFDNWVLSLAATSDTVYAGGTFTHAGTDVVRNHLAALYASSGSPTAWNPSADDDVLAIQPDCGGVYVGGRFTHIDGNERDYLAELDPSSGHVTDWNPDASSYVLALADGPESIYAGGQFSIIGGGLHDGIAQLSKATGQATGWDYGAENSSTVRALALNADGTTLYAGGDFTNIGGYDRTRLAALDTGTGQALSWNPFLDGKVYAVVASGGAVFAGGAFTQAGDGSAQLAQRGFAAFDAADAAAAPPAAPCSDTSNTNQQQRQQGDGNQPPIVGSSPSPPLPPLKILSFKVKPPRFRVAYPSLRRREAQHTPHHKPPLGTAFAFDLTRDAKVTIVIDRELLGRRHGKRCVAPHGHHGRRCTRYQVYGTLKRHGRRGENMIAFTGMFGRLGLPRGVYTAKLTALGAGGHRSSSRLARFEVVR